VTSMSDLEVESNRATAIIRRGSKRVRVILTWDERMNRPTPFTLTRLLMQKGEWELEKREIREDSLIGKSK
jgi:hypothetical protein